MQDIRDAFDGEQKQQKLTSPFRFWIFFVSTHIFYNPILVTVTPDENNVNIYFCLLWMLKTTMSVIGALRCDVFCGF